MMKKKTLDMNNLAKIYFENNGYRDEKFGKFIAKQKK